MFIFTFCPESGSVTVMFIPFNPILIFTPPFKFVEVFAGIVAFPVVVTVVVVVVVVEVDEFEFIPVCGF